jgi:hypothetical protein
MPDGRDGGSPGPPRGARLIPPTQVEYPITTEREIRGPQQEVDLRATLRHIRGQTAAGATGDRVGADAGGDLAGRKVREFPEIAIRQNGTIELCKPN